MPNELISVLYGGLGVLIGATIPTMEVAEFALKVIAGLAAALWAFWIWGAERQKDREELERKRKQRTALYLIPYLFACEELQSRIFNILKKSGLGTLRGKDIGGKPIEPADLSYAEETLYLIAQYFGWQHCIYRYYFEDAETIQCALRIRDFFATDTKCLKGAFCFFRPEQRLLGKTIMQRIAGELGGEFDVIGFEDFCRKLNSPDFSARSSIQKTLEALRDAKVASDLDKEDASRRLAMIQNELVDLLSHIEKQEGVSFFLGERKKVKIPEQQKRPETLS